MIKTTSTDGSAHSFRQVVWHGRVLSHPAVQPEGTSRPASYELGHLLQLDDERVLLIASLREQGAQDFCVGNDGFVLHDLEDIATTRAIPINRPLPNYRLKSGQGTGVQAKFPASGGFVPLGARLPNGASHPAAGSGFLFSTTATYLPARERIDSQSDVWLEFIQLRWDGERLDVTSAPLSEAPLPETLAGQKLVGNGFLALPDGDGLLFPVVSDKGIVVLRLNYRDERWMITGAGKPFACPGKESEPCLLRHGDQYFVYTRGNGNDPMGRIYSSKDGMNFGVAFERRNRDVPQVLNQGLDGSMYLATNPGPGESRNPLVVYAFCRNEFIEPLVIHDARGAGANLLSPETPLVDPLVDHGVGFNVMLGGRPRHLLFYRICERRETDGSGAPPTAHTGLYLVELIYA